MCCGAREFAISILKRGLIFSRFFTCVSESLQRNVEILLENSKELSDRIERLSQSLSSVGPTYGNTASAASASYHMSGTLSSPHPARYSDTITNSSEFIQRTER